MNSFEAEYSFLAPTWKLPPVGTTSMYPGSYGTLRSPPTSKLTAHESNWHHTMPNSRYAPPNTNRRPQPPIQQAIGHHTQFASPHSNEQYRNNGHSHDNNDTNDQYDMPIHSRQDDYPDNRGYTHPPPIQKRVQIIDHHRQTPSSDYLSEPESQTSHSPDVHRKQKRSPPRRSHIEDSRSDATHESAQRSNKLKIHDYLYGLSVPDPGSYVSAYKNQRRRLDDEKVNRKTVMTDYKNFVRNGGFASTFGNTGEPSYEQRLDTEKKRKSYSQNVREINQYKLEEHKRIQNNGGQQRNGNRPFPMVKHRRPDATRSHFLSAQEFLSTPRHFFYSPALREASFNDLHPWNQIDLLSGELYIHRSPTPTVYRLDYIPRFISPEDSSKTASRNVRFGPEILDEEKQVTIPSTTPMTTKVKAKDSLPTKTMN